MSLKSSSPDPLNDSYQSTPKPQLSSRSKQTSSQKNIPKRQIFQLDVGNEISPQKIRVTVEADDDEIDDVNNSTPYTPNRPADRQNKKFATVKGLKKGSSDSVTCIEKASIPKKSVGRPRKSTCASSTKKIKTKRKNTPKKLTEDSTNTDNEGNARYQTLETPTPASKKSKSSSGKPKNVPQTKSTAQARFERSSTFSGIVTEKKIKQREHSNPHGTILQENSPPQKNIDYSYNFLHTIDKNQANSNSTRNSIRSDGIKGDIKSDVFTAPSNSKNNDLLESIKSSSPKEGHSIIHSKIGATYYPSPASPKVCKGSKLREALTQVHKNQSNKGVELNNHCETGPNLTVDSEILDPQESDTIFESEGFSLISTSSLPSLKEHIRSPKRNSLSVSQISGRPVSKRNNQGESYSIIEKPSEAATSAQNVQNHVSLLTMNTTEAIEDSNPELERNLSHENSFSGIAPESPQKDVSKTVGSSKNHKSNSKDQTCVAYDRSFLTDPPDLLDLGPSIAQHHSQSQKETNISFNLPNSRHILLSNQGSGPLPRLSRSQKKNSPSINNKFQNKEPQSPSFRASARKNSRKKHKSPIHYSRLSSPPLVSEPSSHDSVISQEKCQHKNLDISKSPSVIFSSPSLPQNVSMKCDKSSYRITNHDLHDFTPEKFSPLLSSKPYSNSHGVSTTNSPADTGSKSTYTVESVLFSPENHPKNSSSQSLNLTFHGEQISNDSEQSTSLKKDQCSSLSLNQEKSNFDFSFRKIQPNSIKDRNSNSMIWNSEKSDSISKTISPKNFKSHTNDNSGEEGEDDFQLLLDTLNSSSPVPPRLPQPLEEIYERLRTPETTVEKPDLRPKSCINSGYDINVCNLDSPNNSNGKNQKANVAVNETSSDKIIEDQLEDSSRESVDLSNFQISQISNVKQTIEKTSDMKPSTELKTSSQRKLLTMPKKSSKLPSLKQTSFNDSPFNIGLNSSKKISSEIAGDQSEFTPISQKAGFKPRSKAVFSSSRRASSICSDESEDPLSISSNLKFRTPKKIHQSAYGDSLLLSHKVEARKSSGKASSKNEMINSRNHIPARTQSPNPSFTSTAQRFPEKTPPNSPTKSCLRSPQRAIKFPVPFGTPSKAVTFVSSPSPSSPLHSPLSATSWTRNHWLELEKIVQRWKPENLSENLSPDEQKCRNSTRVISSLLGKYVTGAGGERMRLEQWHLEAVDEFRGIVPGWEESDVALRLFALLMGEKVRAGRKRKNLE